MVFLSPSARAGVLALATLGFACSGSEPSSADNEVVDLVGGAAGSSGSSTSQGGASGQAGSPNSGGSTSKGGASSTGGAAGSGGAKATDPCASQQDGTYCGEQIGGEKSVLYVCEG